MGIAIPRSIRTVTIGAILTATPILFTIFLNYAVAGDFVGKPRVVDGDTITIAGVRIRLQGIDAPEQKQLCQKANGTVYRCGLMATFALAAILENHWVTCKGDKVDRYRRQIATCYAGPHDVNAKMVDRGWALAYRRYSLTYVPNENTAKKKRRGLWQGTFIPPWDWRRGKR